MIDEKQQYSAGEKFYNLLVKNPSDFTIRKEQMRTYDRYSIHHNGTNIGIAFDVSDEDSTITVCHNTKLQLNFVHNVTLTNIHKFILARIEEEKLNLMISEDQQNINKIEVFYNTKEVYDKL